MSDGAACWWERPGLRFEGGELCLQGTPFREWTEAFGTPCYLYDRKRICQNAEGICCAMEQIPGAELFYALKANKHPVVLETLRPYLDGIDAASPQEVEMAFAWGFPIVSFTGTSVSPRDLSEVARFSTWELTVTCDNLTMLEDIDCSLSLGVRFNTGIGAGSCEEWRMGGARPTKFGLHQSHWEKAMETISRRNLDFRQVHQHIGSGWLREGSQQLKDATGVLLSFFEENGIAVPPVMNIGGGVGVPLSEEDSALNLTDHFAELALLLDNRFEKVVFEPGDALVKDAGFLLVTVTYEEERAGTRFVGVDAGFNVLCLPAHYGLNNEVVAVRQHNAPVPTVVAGNLCEAGDIFSPRAFLPPDIQAGEVLVMMNCGGYGQSMSSNHCGRPHAKEVVA